MADDKPMKPLLVGMIALLVVSTQARADRITTVTASTPNMGAGFLTDITNTVNGTGLSALSLTATHSQTSTSNSWVSSGAILTGNVIFDFGSTYFVDSFSFWNQNGGGPGANGVTGIQGVAVSTSLDGISYTPLVGGPTQFSQVVGSTALAPEIFNFAAVNARFFQFTITSNWGDPSETGFAEVGFDAVPEPTTLSLMSIGALALVLRLRARRVRA